MDARAQIQERLRQLHEEFAQALHQRLDNIGSLWRRVRDEEAPADALRELHRCGHSLAGSAGTFGYPGLGVVARSIEELLKRPDAAQRLLEPETQGEVERLLAELGGESAKPAPAWTTARGPFNHTRLPSAY